MVSRTKSRECGRGPRLEMSDSDRQMDWTRHSKSSRRLRRPLVANLHRGWQSINHDKRHSEQQAAPHRNDRRQSTNTERNVISCRAIASSLNETTSGGEQQKISAAARKRVNCKKPSTATKSMKIHLKFYSPPLAALSIIGFSAALLMLANEMTPIICDTQVRGGSNGAGHSSKPVTSAARSPSRVPHPVHLGEVQMNQRSSGMSAPAKSRIASPSASSTPVSHKESILSSLMDSIEWQHMKLRPGIRSLSLARPSKFDSGSEGLREAEMASANLGTVQMDTRLSHQAPDTPGSRQHTKTLDDIMNQHYGQAAKKKSGGSISSAGSKAEQELRQIMMLHEQAVPSHAIHSTSAKAEPQQTTAPSRQANIMGKHLARLKSGTEIGLKYATNSTAASKHLWSLAVPTGSSEATKTGKVLTNVAAYLSPLAVGKKQARVNSTNPFTPRMNGKSLLLGPLLGLGQMFAPDIMQQAGNKYTSPPFAASPSETPTAYVLSNAINQPQDYSSSLKGLATDKKPAELSERDIPAQESPLDRPPPRAKSSASGVASWIKIGANQLAQSHSFQDSFRDLLTLSQLPILLSGPVSTAPSELEPGGKKYKAKKVSQQQPIKGLNRTQAIDDIFRYAYILGNLGVRRKRDPLKVLGPSPSSNALMLTSGSSKHPLWTIASRPASGAQNALIKLPSLRLNNLIANRKIKPRGVMWDMATDPSLAVTVFHLLERASVALPLGFLLMPFVHMIRNPLNGINLGRIIPARASHRSVDYEELARRINSMDKMLSRALRPTHRESSPLSFLRR